MGARHTVTRRGFVGGVAAGLGTLGLGADPLAAHDALPRVVRAPMLDRPWQDDYDSFAKLANNENPWGPSEPVMQAMTKAFKYSNRYGYPDGDIVEAIAEHHEVEPDNVLIAAGSGEILKIVGLTFLRGGRKVIGVEPSYAQVYQHATGIQADAIRIPLLDGYEQDVPAMIRAARRNHREVGFVYLCNPNNPTGRIVPKQQVARLLDEIPEDVPVLADEAYHHYVRDPAYATSIPAVREGRPVIVARTFSKIWGLAGMRLGYAVAPRELIEKMRPWSTGTINALVKWGGVAALRDMDSQIRVRDETIRLRTRTAAALDALGYDVIPSETNFFMVHIRTPVQPVITAFRERGVLVGRPFPPMLDHLRVSIGTPEEMDRFMVAFKDIFPVTSASSG